MKVINIKLKNFRNYEDLDLAFDGNMNIIVGKNAQGKTNIVEALYIMSTLKSFRNSKLHDCIREDCPFAEIEINVENENRIIKNLKLKINGSGENDFFVNGNKISQKKEMIGWLYAVVFSPDELKIVKGAPETRREFLDTDICQISKAYSGLLARYEILLLSRNKLLKFAKNSSTLHAQLDIYEEQMALIGGQISISRQNFVQKLNNYANNIMQALSGGKETLKIEYVGIDGDTREEKSENFLKLLKESRKKDLELGFSSVGPHRDDLKFIVNEKEVKPFASQGQQRSVVLATKIAEMKTLTNEKEKPIMILDDVFSELDSARQKMLVDYFVDSQVFITSTTCKSGVGKFGTKYRVNCGKVKVFDK